MARRPPEDFRVDGQLHRSRVPRYPCGPPAAQSALQSWLAARLQGRARSPLLVTACLRGKGHIGSLMRETRACSWADSRFGQQDKQWSLHTAITICSPLPLRCCNAAQSELWTATSDWSASGRSPVKT